MKKFEIKVLRDIEKTKDGYYRYDITFSDCPFILVYGRKSRMKCLEVRAKVEERYQQFVSRESDEFVTSDLGFKYIKKEARVYHCEHCDKDVPEEEIMPPGDICVDCSEAERALFDMKMEGYENQYFK